MSISVVLPPSTNIYIVAFTNASFIQKITVTPPAGAGSPFIYQGTGEGNHQIGNQMLITPTGSSNLTYTVDMEYSSDSGSTWEASTMIPGDCVVGTMNSKLVISEDHADQDYNDAVIQFMWWGSLS